jgi:hypothetical protein
MNWLTQLLSRRQLYRDLSEEIQAHLDEKIEELVADGMSREEARHTAMREFGNPALLEENSRDVWAWPSIENLLLDVRYGLRTLRRNPVFTVVALLTISIGIAANVAVFTVVNSILLRPLHYPQAEQLVALHQVAPGAEGLADFENGLLLSPSMYFTYAEHNRTFQSLGVWGAGTANATGIAEPEQVRSVAITDGVLQTFSVPPAIGRWLLQADQVPDGPQRVMLSYGYWQRRFGGSPAVVGKNIMLDSQPREIVGVMPRGFQFVDADFDVIVPLAFDRGKAILAGFGFHGIARLKPGATISEANADIARMIPIWMDSFSNGPGSNPRVYETWKITPMLRPLKQEVVGRGASAGIGRSSGAWCGLGKDRARTSRRKPDAWSDGWDRGHWSGVCRSTISRRDRSLESASAQRNLPGCADARVCLAPFNSVELILWVDSSSEICAAAAQLGSSERRTHDQRQPGAASRAQSAGCGSGSNGPRLASERGVDDSHIPGHENSRSGFRGSPASATPANFHSRFVGGPTPTSHTDTTDDSREVRGDAGREVCGLRE